jgi:hypothetical protein
LGWRGWARRVFVQHAAQSKAGTIVGGRLASKLWPQSRRTTPKLLGGGDTEIVLQRPVRAV